MSKHALLYERAGHGAVGLALTAIVLLVFAPVAIAQQATYTHDDTASYSWVEISGTGTDLVLADDGHSFFAVPFPINFYGVSYNYITVGANGHIYFLNSASDESNESLPINHGYAETFIAGFWDDVVPSDAGAAVYYQVQGSPPNRQIVVEWHDVGHFNADPGDVVTFEIILYENSDNIRMQYQDVYFGDPLDAWLDYGGSATVGVQRHDAEAVQYSYNSAVLSANMAILWTWYPPPAAIDWFMGVPNYGGGADDELAVLGVAKSGGAVMAQTKDAGGGAALASTYYLSSAWSPFGLALVSNFGGGAADEIATLATANSSGAIIAQVKDATGGAALATTYYLSAAWTPKGFEWCPNFGGGADELAVLATANSSGAVIVQVKDASSGASLATTYYLSAAWSPVDMVAMPNFAGSGAPELAVLATANSGGAIIAQVKDATGGAALASTYYLSAAWTPLALEFYSDFGGSAADELAVLATANSSGAVIVQVKDASTGATLASTYYLSAAWTPVAMQYCPDFAGGPAEEIAVLATANSSGAIIVQVKDATGGAALATTYYLSAAWSPRAIEIMPDMNANGAAELAVLGVDKGSGAIIVQVKDASTGATLASTYYLSAAWDTQL